MLISLDGTAPPIVSTRVFHVDILPSLRYMIGVEDFKEMIVSHEVGSQEKAFDTRVRRSRRLAAVDILHYERCLSIDTPTTQCIRNSALSDIFVNVDSRT